MAIACLAAGGRFFLFFRKVLQNIQSPLDRLLKA